MTGSEGQSNIGRPRLRRCRTVRSPRRCARGMVGGYGCIAVVTTWMLCPISTLPKAIFPVEICHESLDKDSWETKSNPAPESDFVRLTEAIFADASVSYVPASGRMEFIQYIRLGTSSNLYSLSLPSTRKLYASGVYSLSLQYVASVP